MKVVVLQGGPSREADISRKSGARVFAALKQKGFTAIQRELDDRIWERLKQDKPELVFIALHGRMGEDGCIQGMLELMEIPYTGSGVLASALGMDKCMTKKAFRQAKIPHPAGFSISSSDLTPMLLRETTCRINDTIGLPCVIKPCNEGSTIGLSIVKQRQGIAAALKTAMAVDKQIIIEQYIKGQEVTVGLLGNDQPVALPVVEIVSAKELYDYEAKYTQGMSEHIIPARLPKRIANKLQKTAIQAHQAIGCRGMSRVDFIVSDKQIYALEINTIPGLTEVSLYPDAAKAAGMSFADLIERIVCLALQNC